MPGNFYFMPKLFIFLSICILLGPNSLAQPKTIPVPFPLRYENFSLSGFSSYALGSKDVDNITKSCSCTSNWNRCVMASSFKSGMTLNRRVGKRLSHPLMITRPYVETAILYRLRNLKTSDGLLQVSCCRKATPFLPMPSKTMASEERGWLL